MSGGGRQAESQQPSSLRIVGALSGHSGRRDLDVSVAEHDIALDRAQRTPQIGKTKAIAQELEAVLARKGIGEREPALEPLLRARHLVRLSLSLVYPGIPLDDMPEVRGETRRLLHKVQSLVSRLQQSLRRELGASPFGLPRPTQTVLREEFGQYEDYVASMWPCVPHLWLELRVREVVCDAELPSWEPWLERMWDEAAILLILQRPGELAARPVQQMLERVFLAPSHRSGRLPSQTPELQRMRMLHAQNFFQSDKALLRPMASRRRPTLSLDDAINYYHKAVVRKGLDYRGDGEVAPRTARKYRQGFGEKVDVAVLRDEGIRRREHRSACGWEGAGELAERFDVPRSTVIDFVRKLAKDNQAEKRMVGRVKKWWVSPEGRKRLEARFGQVEDGYSRRELARVLRESDSRITPYAVAKSLKKLEKKHGRRVGLIPREWVTIIADQLLSISK